jgi:dihydroneopterin aldolase
MDEAAVAFEPPHERASATHAGPPLDRISVRDYVRAVEIGAFHTERGVTQRIRFNVVLEVSRLAAAQADDVDQVISYDTITEAIESALGPERVDLLETLAERVAQLALADPRAVRAFVRLEKLDRIPGALGVEIVRTRPSDAPPRLRPAGNAAAAPPAARPRVAYLGTAALLRERAWLDALAGWGRPVVLCLGPAEPVSRPASEGARRIGLLAIEQAAWALTDRDPRWSVTESRTELDWALKSGGLPVWAPARMVAASRQRPRADASDPLGLAAWLAAEIGADALVAADEAAAPAPGPFAFRALDPARPEDLSETA